MYVVHFFSHSIFFPRRNPKFENKTKIEKMSKNVIILCIYLGTYM